EGDGGGPGLPWAGLGWMQQHLELRDTQLQKAIRDIGKLAETLTSTLPKPPKPRKRAAKQHEQWQKMTAKGLSDQQVANRSTDQARQDQLGLLGSLAADFSRLGEAQAIVRADDFPIRELANIYRGYERLHAEGIALDRTALRGQMLARGLWPADGDGDTEYD